MCWHKWSKWERFDRQMMLLANTEVKYIEKWQKRRCEKCGYVQEEEV